MKPAKPSKIRTLTLCAVLAASSGCVSTITPPVVHTEQPSWDGNAQNSGIVGVAPDGVRLMVTPRFKARFWALSKKYGEFLDYPETPTLAGWSPMPNGNWLVSPVIIERFVNLNQLRKQGY